MVLARAIAAVLGGAALTAAVSLSAGATPIGRVFVGCNNAVIDQSGPGSRAYVTCGGLSTREFRTVGLCGSGSYVYGAWVPDDYVTRSVTSRCYTGFDSVYTQRR